MKFLLSLLLLAQGGIPPYGQTTSPPLAHQGPGSLPPWGNHLVPDEDLGTIPYEAMHYILVMPSVDGVSLHGVQVKHTRGNVSITYEYVELDQLMAQSQVTDPPYKPGASWSGDLPADVVFAPGYTMLDPDEPQNVCAQAPCAAPNSLCSGWCSMEQWYCLCTEYDKGQTSSTIVKRHKNRVWIAQLDFPPDP